MKNLYYIWKNIESTHCFNQICDDLKNGQLVIFAGSGISVDPPSNLPAGNKWRKQLLDKMESICKKHIISIDKTEWVNARKSHRFLMPETIFEHTYRIFGEKSLKFFDVLDTKNFNFCHKVLSNFASKGMLKKLITLNFDVLIEEALNSEHVGYIVITPKNEWKINQHLGQHITLYKPHGSFPLNEKYRDQKYDDLIYSLSTIQQNPLEKVEQNIIEMTKDRSILFIGYSDNDLDIFPIFFNNSNLFNKVYWFEYQEEKNRRNPEDIFKDRENLMHWIEKNQYYCIIGNLSEFFDLLTKYYLNEDLKRLEGRKVNLRYDTSFYDEDHIRTIIAYSVMLENIGERHLCIKILEILINDYFNKIQIEPTLLAIIYRTLCYANHVFGNYEKAASYLKKAIKTDLGIKVHNRLASDRIRLTYEYLSIIKRNAILLFRPDKKIKKYIYYAISSSINFMYLLYNFFLIKLDIKKSNNEIFEENKNKWIIYFHIGDLFLDIGRLTLLRLKQRLSQGTDIIYTLKKLRKLNIFLAIAELAYYKAHKIRKYKIKEVFLKWGLDYYQSKLLETQFLRGKTPNLKIIERKSAKDIKSGIEEIRNQIREYQFSYYVKIGNDPQVGRSYMLLWFLDYVLDNKKNNDYFNEACNRFNVNPKYFEGEEKIIKPSGGVLGLIFYFSLINDLSGNEIFNLYNKIVF
jgi:hypothetical protein